MRVLLQHYVLRVARARGRRFHGDVDTRITGTWTPGSRVWTLVPRDVDSGITKVTVT